MTGKNLLSLAFRTIGIVFAAIAAVVAVYALAFVLRSDSAIGVVVDNSILQSQIVLMPRSNQSGVLFYPVIAYSSADGEQFFTGPMGRPNPEFQVGTEVPILVSGINSDDVRLDTLFGVWGTSLVLGGLSAIFLFLSLAAPLGFGGMRR